MALHRLEQLLDHGRMRVPRGNVQRSPSLVLAGIDLSALLKAGVEGLNLQLYADVQNQSTGRALELVLISRESMGTGAPRTRQVFEQLISLVEKGMEGMDLQFRSDLQGPLQTAP